MNGLKQGVVIAETDDTVSILTGFKSASNNEKTGEMIQQWNLYKHEKPVMAARNGNDGTVCGTCPHRWFSEDEDADQACYVNLGQAPTAIWNAWRRGSYAPITDKEVYKDSFKENEMSLRFGAYGNPSVIPVDTVDEWIEASNGHTGYIHDWKDKPEYVGRFQASVDSVDEYNEAKDLGFNTFRIDGTTDGRPMRGETLCINTAKPSIKCSECLLCNGKSRDIYNHSHGSRVGRFNRQAA
tara:strand:+ start:674 stop:1393 length:720 start_codon:yes stop_codon:yes gene_type:complete